MSQQDVSNVRTACLGSDPRGCPGKLRKGEASRCCQLNVSNSEVYNALPSRVGKYVHACARVASATRSPYSHDLIADLWSDPTVAVHGTDFKVNSQSRCGSDPSRAYASICKATPAPWVPMACDREMEMQEKGKPCNRRKLVRRRYCAGGLRGYLPTPPLKNVDNFDSHNEVRPDR